MGHINLLNHKTMHPLLLRLETVDRNRKEPEEGEGRLDYFIFAVRNRR